MLKSPGGATDCRPSGAWKFGATIPGVPLAALTPPQANDRGPSGAKNKSVTALPQGERCFAAIAVSTPIQSQLTHPTPFANNSSLRISPF